MFSKFISDAKKTAKSSTNSLKKSVQKNVLDKTSLKDKTIGLESIKDSVKKSVQSGILDKTSLKDKELTIKNAWEDIDINGKFDDFKDELQEHVYDGTFLEEGNIGENLKEKFDDIIDNINLDLPDPADDLKKWLLIAGVAVGGLYYMTNKRN